MENFSPVVNDVTFQVVITQMIIEKWILTTPF